MLVKICESDPTALDKLPPRTADKSGVGVHYADAFIKPLNVVLPDGVRVKCKRRGLKILLAVGDRTGDGLLRRLQHGPDPVAMLAAALEEAATAAGGKLHLTPDGVYWEPTA